MIMYHDNSKTADAKDIEPQGPCPPPPPPHLVPTNFTDKRIFSVNHGEFADEEDSFKMEWRPCTRKQRKCSITGAPPCAVNCCLLQVRRALVYEHCLTSTLLHTCLHHHGWPRRQDSHSHPKNFRLIGPGPGQPLAHSRPSSYPPSVASDSAMNSSIGWTITWAT